MKTVLKTVSVMAGLAALAAGGWFLWMKSAPRETPAGQPLMATLDPAALPAFRESFNACSHEARLLLLLSPT